ncbi:hypothetical protein FYB92_13605 [Novacetimonas sp. GS1]
MTGMPESRNMAWHGKIHGGNRYRGSDGRETSHGLCKSINDIIKTDVSSVISLGVAISFGYAGVGQYQTLSFFTSFMIFKNGGNAMDWYCLEFLG